MSVMKLSDYSIGKKMNIMALVALVSMILISVFFLEIYRESLFADKQEKTQNIVEVAYSTIDSFVKKSKQGLLTEVEAKEQAKDAVQALRYDKTNYFWINDRTPRMIMHPLKPQLNGKSLSETKDPTGKFLFVEMVNVVKKNGAGFVDYMWSKPGQNPDILVPKISYVKEVPAWGWIVGSGIYVDDVERDFWESAIFIGSIILVIMILQTVVSWFLSRDIKLPIIRLSGNLTDMCGDKETDIVDHKRQDEIGVMAQSLFQLDQKLVEAKKIEAQQQEMKLKTEQEKKETMKRIAVDFDSKVGGLIVSLGTAAGQLQGTAESMRSLADHTSSSSENVANSSSVASQNVMAVSSAMEEMSVASNEISSQMATVRSKSTDTAESAERANGTVTNLDQLAENIGAVVVAIRDIAEQTNLLALNATIEAARAGDAGKGFAVVADEVKKLASETASKTEEIETRITEIQSATKDAVAAMGNIIGNISEIDHSVSGVSAAVEEQSSTTSEIVRSVSDASDGVKNVFDIIQDVQKSASETGLSSDTVLEAAKEVNVIAENLKESVQEFLKEIQG